MRSFAFLLYVFLLFQTLFASPLSVKRDVDEAVLEERSGSPTSTVEKLLTSARPGDYVGVRPQAYEEKSKDNSKVSIHPGVVVSGPNQHGEYGVAMISKKLPHDPPQKDIKSVHPGTTLYGNVHLGPPKMLKLDDMRQWVEDKTGHVQSPMPKEHLNGLHKAMEPHKDWKEPTPPPSPVIPAAAPASPKSPGKKTPPPSPAGAGHKVASGSGSSNWRTGNPNHAGSSRNRGFSTSRTNTNAGQQQQRGRQPQRKNSKATAAGKRSQSKSKSRSRSRK